MQFIHHDLGSRAGGEIVEVALSGSAANVRLLDSTNLASYRAGRSHRCIGGLATKSPVRLRIPHSGRWHVVVDMAGLRGRVRSSAHVLPSAMSPISEQPLSSLPSLFRASSPESSGSDEDHESFDVFISHASEDKDDVVRPLAHALRERQLSVWFDEFELRIGDSLRRKIDRGLAASRFGVVVLSKSFFTKGWPNYELDGLVTKGMAGDQVLLPIWHGITKAEVISYSPSLADKLARTTAAHTLDEIADEIAAVIHSR